MRFSIRLLLITVLAGISLAGCATTPPYVSATVTTEGAMDKISFRRHYAWILDEAQRDDPLTYAIVSEANGHLLEGGMIEAESVEDAEVLIAISTDTQFEANQTYTYNVQRYVPGPSHSFEREVAVYDYNGLYLGTRREVVTERQPGHTVTEQRVGTTDGYNRLIELSFIDAFDFRQGSAEPFYIIRSDSDGRSDNIGPVGLCMIEMMFNVFPGSRSEGRLDLIVEEEEDYCNLPGF